MLTEEVVGLSEQLDAAGFAADAADIRDVISSFVSEFTTNAANVLDAGISALHDGATVLGENLEGILQEIQKLSAQTDALLANISQIEAAVSASTFGAVATATIATAIASTISGIVTYVGGVKKLEAQSSLYFVLELREISDKCIKENNRSQSTSSLENV